VVFKIFDRTNKQIDKQTGKQTNKQTDIQARSYAGGSNYTDY